MATVQINPGSDPAALDKALKAAKPGDTIVVQPGRHAGQALTYDASKEGAGRHVVVKGEGATFDGMLVKGVQWVEFNGLTIRGNFKVTLSTDNQNVPSAKTSHDLIFLGIDCQVFLWRNVENAVLAKSKVGGQDVSVSNLSVPKIGAYVAEDGAPARLSKNILIEDVLFHDIIRTQTQTTHCEGFYFDAGCVGVTIRGCKFTNCGVFDIFSNGQAAGRPIDDILIEGNQLDIPRDTAGGVAASAINFKGGAGKVVIRGNSIGGNIRKDTAAYQWTSEKNAIAGTGGSSADFAMLPNPGFVSYKTTPCELGDCYENDLHVKPDSPAGKAGAGVPQGGTPPPDPDTTPPVITVPADITVEATDENGAVVSYTVSAVDDTDATPTLVCEPPTGSLFPVGVTTVECLATDDAGNTAEATFLVTVSPVVVPPPALVAPDLGLGPQSLSSVTVEWPALAGVTEYRFYKDGTFVSNTNDGARTSVKFGSLAYRRYVLGVEAVYPNGKALSEIPVEPSWHEVT